MTKHRDLSIPASAQVLFSAPAGARVSYYVYYFGSFSGRYA